MTRKSEEAARSMAEYGVAWPDGSEDLFRLTADERGHVLVRHMDSSYDRAEGFKRAGDALADRCIELAVGGSIEETMVLAVLHAYHHAIEIELKRLLGALYRFHGVEKGRPHHHEIVELWTEVRGLLRRTSGDLTDAVDVSIARCLTQLAESTAKGEACRYSHDDKGNRLEMTQHFLDLANLKEVVNRITTYLAWMRDRYVDREAARREWEKEQKSW
ncbi:MAG: hypothetical protein A3H28_12420 [Acidobacteria bacterium RIFCSPLOWO2_02_FULL_61_28]|nr:MAG: hypothetical protein A3H28_12420 [Acidobacteria bacterium RIFCSPLOWO2_02_FULL_61_28]OFW48135.1 MAG: hypothetical protein A3G77_04680 [Acidobacteria bacterium RIFCSPLOWO2_12_FULL_68_19]